LRNPIRRRAHIEFGGVEQCKERLRADRPGAILKALVQEVGLSVRRLRRRQGDVARGL